MRFNVLGKKVVVYLPFTREFKVGYSPKNVVAVGANENNFTVASSRMVH
ncbi:MAG: hypothetical protein LM571_01955 [Desulfurococcaceae archaeon]|nr:hypothetical protein [Desulfurococcaceae archaeon]